MIGDEMSLGVVRKGGVAILRSSSELADTEHEPQNTEKAGLSDAHKHTGASAKGQQKKDYANSKIVKEGKHKKQGYRKERRFRISMLSKFGQIKNKTSLNVFLVYF